MSEERELIETVDAEGNVIKFELYDIVEVEEQEYALLLPADEDADDELVLMRLSKDGEDYIFESIDDDDEFNRVAEYVQTMDEADEEE